MPHYTTFPDSDRGDSFQVPSHYYAPNELVHVPLVQGQMPDDNVLCSKRFPIELARHHIISWKIIRTCWNKCITDNIEEVCSMLINLLSETYKLSPDANDLCWAKRNLIIGPLGNHRMFDPGEELDFESPVGLSGNRQRHVAAMIELGKLMNAYVGGLDKAIFKKKFRTMMTHCKSLSGNQVCVFNRNEWKLNIKPIVTWKLSFTGNYETDGKPTPPLWHRGSYSPASANKYYRPDASATEKATKTAALRKKTHSSFIQSLGNDVKKAQWKFLNI
jgi:hypothetical protein